MVFQLITRPNPLGNKSTGRQDADDLQRIRDRASRIQNCGRHRLRSMAEELREAAGSPDNSQGFTSAYLGTAFALALEATRRSTGMQLYDVQVLAALALARGTVAEMQTGEGKTLAAVPAAVAHGLTGLGVHVVTPNSYLAERDFELLRDVYASLGLTAGLLPEQAMPAEKQKAYGCDITYGTGYEFGFDYLRDQLALQQSAQLSLGQALISQLSGRGPAAPQTVQRGLAFAIIDEIDNVLLDDAGSPLVLSGASASLAKDAEAFLAARDVSQQLEREKHFQVIAASGVIELTPTGIQRIHESHVAIPVKQLRRTWTEYVEQALRAQFLFQSDVHYIVVHNEIQIVDATTGRIFTDRTWRDGLHQAIEAKESVPITADRSILAQITRQRFYRQYAQLSGMTGTAQGCQREFHEVYGLEVNPIPLRVPSQRRQLPMRCFATSDAKWSAIAQDVRTIHETGRPVLVGTRTIEDSERITGILNASYQLNCQLLNGRQDAEEAHVIAAAGQSGAITIATNLAGRGTDIQLKDDARSRGGLHVVVAEPHHADRVDRQLIGRCGRQGDPGSAQIYLAADDALLQQQGAWLQQSILRWADGAGELSLDLTRRLRRLQIAAARAEYAGRNSLLRRDLARESLLSQLAAGFLS